MSSTTPQLQFLHISKALGKVCPAPRLRFLPNILATFCFSDSLGSEWNRFKSSIIRDWRGRYVWREGFSSITDLSRDSMQSVGAPLLISEANDNSLSSTLNVSGAYIALCPFEKSLSYAHYSTRRIHRLKFIAQNIIFLIRDEATASWEPYVQKTTEKPILNFVQKSTALENHFKKKC